MRRTTSLAALLLGAALLVPAGAATAVGETCRGEAATFVGTGPTIVGTDGRDIIVSGDSAAISAGGGDDIVCVSGFPGSNVHSVDAGPGNDVVDSSALPANYYVRARLGEGSDTFVGGAGHDSVSAGPAAFVFLDVPSESERDVIDTGDGPDDVVSGGPGLPNDDEIRTGNGDDVVTWSGVMGAQSVLDAGADPDLLISRASGQTFGVDLAAQKLSRNGIVEASFASFEQLRVVPEPDLGAVEIVGTEGADDVEFLVPAAVRARLGGGDDNLDLAGTKPGSSIDLGTGTDRIWVESRDGSVALDLADQTMRVDASAAVPLTGVENASVSARQATLQGDSQANVLRAISCLATIDGRAGKDLIDHSNYDVDTEIGYDCTDSGTTLIGGSGKDYIEGGVRADLIYGGRGNDKIKTGPAPSGKDKAWGGPGNDKLFGGGDWDVLNGGPGRDFLKGSRGADVLRGGAGRDRGVGGPGRDRCVAEITKSCER